jgi:hypothetical protein
VAVSEPENPAAAAEPVADEPTDPGSTPASD